MNNGDRPRPNILFAIADDASHMGAYGHTFLDTPHFDRVAAEGVLFTHVYTTNPKCAPSRASIVTGRHTWQLEEASCHFGKFPSKFAVYPSLLADSGYHVGHTGKGWGPGDYEAGGFEHNPAGPAYHGAKLEPPTTGMSAKDYAGNFARFLEERPDGAPFCFWYGAHEPHRHYEEGSGVRAGRSVEDVTPPAYLPDEEIVRSDLLDYALEVEWFDEHLGRILAQLEEVGELDDTLVVVTSDNGMPFPRVKGQMYEHDFNMPFAAMWRGAVKGGRVVTDFISFRDIAPTFLEAAGLAPDDDMTGSSFLGVLTSDAEGRVDASREHVLMAGSATTWGARAISATPSASSERTSGCTSATTSPTGGRQATRRPGTRTWTAPRPAPSSSNSTRRARTRTGRSPWENDRRRSSTASRKTRSACTTWLATRTTRASGATCGGEWKQNSRNRAIRASPGTPRCSTRMSMSVTRGTPGRTTSRARGSAQGTDERGNSDEEA